MRRLLFIGIFVFGSLIASPTLALAHAGFVSSTPAPGAQLGTAPGVVTLRFAEPLNVRFSRAEVMTPDGSDAAGAVTGSEQISIDLTTNAQGIYEVTWTTVSLVDGHALSGSFAFGVGVSPGPASSASTSTNPRAPDLLIAVGRVIEDVALLLAIGLLLMGELARRDPALPWVRHRATPAVAVALAGSLAVVLGESVAAAHTFSPGAIISYLTTGVPGVARLLRPAFEVAALMLCLTGSGWAWLLLLDALVALAAAGHAAAVSPPWWGISTEAIHIGGAAIWAGGILCLALQRPPGGWKGAEGRALIDRFTPIALIAFAATALAGVLRGMQEVGSLHELVSSSYGFALLVKTALVLGTAQLSFLAWRRLLVSPRAEAVALVGVVAVAALLAAYPLPPARSVEADARAEESNVVADSALPIAGEITLGGHAGEFLIGLTLRSSTDGASIFLQGLGSDTDNEAAHATVTADGRPLAIAECGPTCRGVAERIRTGELVDVSVSGPQGGTASFMIPSPGLPAADAVLARMTIRMHALRTYRLKEDLSGGKGSVRSTYEFEAPRSFGVRSVSSNGSGSDVTWINDTRYLRLVPNGGWQVERGVSAPKVPFYVWDTFEPFIDARLLGTPRLDGVRTDEVIFFGGQPGLPVWFHMWIDHTGLVRRAEMRAPGHFMDHRYFAFDKPLRIEAPAGVVNPGSGT